MLDEPEEIVAEEFLEDGMEVDGEDSEMDKLMKDICHNSGQAFGRHCRPKRSLIIPTLRLEENFVKKSVLFQTGGATEQQLREGS